MHVNIVKLFDRQRRAVEVGQNMIVIGFVGRLRIKKHPVAVKRNNLGIVRKYQPVSFFLGLMILPYTLIFKIGLSLLSVLRITVS